MTKLVGALLIIFGCGGAGYLVVATYRYQVQSFEQFIRAMEYMECDLRYRMTPLPELCSGASQVCTGCVSVILERLCAALEAQTVPNAEACMKHVLLEYSTLSASLGQCFSQLSVSLGRFDLPGQIQGLASVKEQAEFELKLLQSNQSVRLRNYQTLGLCAGAALAVLFW